ncbi:serine/arginine repetitive matrix protein 2 isoform X2 [Megalobrama amblycephala]|uniref:serine/arginine repetitive matrix protein 2 isoform X2 n=1 Tax=Megalobrama amblycephala TaxID=75352 RepID=UPI0020147F0F|nr:serine/arginine repetitive matrix protein 2 isoform X2 [Megalobrama amblycephala]
MYRGPSNPDYHRAPVPPSGFGHPAASFGPPPFCPPFGVPPGPQYCAPQQGPPPGRPYGAGNENYNRESFYENRPFNSHTADQSGSTSISSQLTPSNQSSLSWSTKSLDEQNQEVRKKAEEFLRILQSGDRIELAADKSDTSDRTADKHPSRARSRSRGKSRPRSRSRSHGRSRGRSRARSRGKSRARSRTRSRSRSRAKSRTRAKSRARSRSRSRSHGKSVTNSKSQSRLSPSQTKQSYRGTAEGNHSSSSTSSGVSLGANAMPDLFHGLRQILQNKDLEKHLPMVKNALHRDQSTDGTRGMFLGNQTAVGGFQNPEPRFEPESSTELCYGSLLPHERAGGDSCSISNILSWNTLNQLPESKPAFQSVEDEEKFLYGEQEERSKPQAVTVPLAQTRSARSPVLHFSKEEQTHNLQEPKAHGMPASVQPTGLGTMKVTPEECEKVKNLLRTIGLNPSMTDIYKMAARLKEKKEEQGVAASFPLLKPALEALQALSRASKTDDSRSNRSGSSHSTHESKREEKMGEKERERREKQIQKKRKEYLVKELEGLMKQEGSGDLIPVMGFFCQRCEEFFGDMNSAERHVASHGRGDRNKTTGSQEQHRDAKRHGDQHHTSSHRRESPSSRATSSRVHHEHRERSPDRKRNRDESTHPTDKIKIKNEPEDKGSKDKSKDKSKEKKEKTDDDDDDAQSTKSEKKRKKKEKKLKKKEKKKKKDKKKAEANKESP